MIETDQLLYERRGATASVTFNRPEARNAMTWEMYDALYECCEEVDADEGVRKPTIAVIDGYAIGGGMSIAAVCDLRLCTPDAKFGIPIARTLGNCLSIENYARLMTLIGPARTKAMIFTARLFSAEEALTAGLATEIVPASELDESLGKLCTSLESHAPITMRVTKEAVRRLQFAELPDTEDLVRETYGSEDFHEGVSAFGEKRRPAWRGREFGERCWTARRH